MLAVILLFWAAQQVARQAGADVPQCCIRNETVSDGMGSYSLEEVCVNAATTDCTDPSNGSLEAGVCVANVCVSGGTMMSDPVLQGFDKSTFEFFGQPGFNYSVLTSAGMAINMQLVPAGPEHVRHQDGAGTPRSSLNRSWSTWLTAHRHIVLESPSRAQAICCSRLRCRLELLRLGLSGTFAGGVGISLPTLEVIAYVDEPGYMTVVVNGNEIDTAVPASWEQVSYEPFRPEYGQTITVSSSPFSVNLVAVKAFTDEVTGYNRGHFDLHAQISGLPTSEVSGVLGQTLRTAGWTNEREIDFEVPNLSYRQPDELLSSISRRLASVPSVEFPVQASLQSGYLSAFFN